MQTYKIIRFYENSKRANKVIKNGLTRPEAQEHCSKVETSGGEIISKDGEIVSTSRWFDGFDKE